MSGTGDDRNRTLQFESFMSVPEITFWQRFAKLKIDAFGLSDAPLDVKGTFSLQRSTKIRAIVRVSKTSFAKYDSKSGNDVDSRIQGRGEWSIGGMMKNVNTVEEFKTFDKVAFMRTAGDSLCEDIASGAAVRDPSLLARFILLTFADLKRHTFLYWFGFPSAAPRKEVWGTYTCSSVTSFDSLCPDAKERHRIGREVEALGSPIAFALLLVDGSEDDCDVSASKSMTTSNGRYRAIALDVLNDLERATLLDPKKIIIGCIDPSANTSHPGWIVRNLLLLLSSRWKMSCATILCFRDLPALPHSSSASRSIVLRVNIPNPIDDAKTLATSLRYVGWERNAKGRFGPRKIELRSQMAPEELAGTAVDLNLKLMRWRMAPELRPETLAKTRCLLIGAGTLGCHTSRLLLGWGVRHITFVDNGRVSYSNPVRQPLFNFTDCVDGGKPKAETAAAALKQIFPGVRSAGVSLTIPMPGHPIPKNAVEACEGAVAKLKRLIHEHDVVFLLTDTRESRWLPTLLGVQSEKLVMSVALGFDTFVVMRHGHRRQDPKDRLGCYFCNDVVAPTDSTRNRALDQQCTVTRPGLAAVASANAVELMVNLLHHPLGACARADGETPLSEACASPFGILPHQVRGFVSHFHQILPIAKYFPRCTACSNVVIDAYERDGFDFLLKVFNDPAYSEKLTGLSELQKSVSKIDIDWDSGDSDEAFC
eukprot:g715.t1